MKLATKLSLLILASVLLPLLGLGSAIYFMQKQTMEQQLHQQLRQIGASTRSQIEHRLLEHHHDLAVIAGSSTLRAAPSQADYGLRRYLAFFRTYDALLFVDPQGKLIAKAGETLLTRGESSLEQAIATWMEEANAERTIIDRVTPEAGQMQRYLVFAQRADYGGQHRGWIFGQVNSEKIADIVSAVSIGETGRVTLFNGAGILIGHPVKSRYGYNMSNYPIMRKPVVERVGDPGGVFVSGDGREKWGMTLMLSAKPELARLNWGLIIDQTRQELYQPVFNLRNIILAGGVFFGIAFALFGVGFARRLMAPLQGLQANLKGFFAFLNRESAAPPLIEVHGNDEFARMAEGINQSIAATEAAIERERALEVLHDEALARLHKIASRLPGVVYQFRLRPDGSFSAPYISDSVLQMYGSKPEDLREDALVLRTLLHPDDRAQFTASLQASAKDLMPWQNEHRIKSPDGSWRWLLGKALPEREEDGSVLWYGFITDITRRRQIEDDLDQYRHRLEQRTVELTQARDAAEAANRAKSAFLATMSHELRTPMNGVVGMIDLVLRRATDPKQIDWLNKSRSSAMHLLDIINNILDISKIEADRMTLEEKNFSFRTVLDEAFQMFGQVVSAKGLRMVAETDAAFPDLLCGDAVRLKQILINLLGNAVKFSAQGQITVRSGIVACDGQSVMLKIDVSDQGIGISPEQQARLFQPFSQADDSMTRKYGGSGLGLSISKRVAQLMGGDAGVVSEEGRGSTFWFTARMKTPGENRAAVRPTATAKVDAEAELRRHYYGHRILLADDESINREVAQIQLNSFGFVVDTAEDGQQALALAQKISYAAILMDMQMPRLNGLDATRQIRELEGYRKTPIIAMTANAFAEDKARCMEAGMSDFLAKPFTPDELIAILLRALNGREV